jgi:hypothetical protein
MTMDDFLGKYILVASVFFSFIELLFPVWGIVLTILLMRRGYSSWKAWGIVSSIFILEVYFIGTYIGYNLGAYVFIFIGYLPHMLYEEMMKIRHTPRGDVDILFWTLPTVVFVIIPMSLLFCLSKLIAKYKSKS